MFHPVPESCHITCKAGGKYNMSSPFIYVGGKQSATKESKSTCDLQEEKKALANSLPASVHEHDNIEAIDTSTTTNAHSTQKSARLTDIPGKSSTSSVTKELESTCHANNYEDQVGPLPTAIGSTDTAGTVNPQKIIIDESTSEAMVFTNSLGLCAPPMHGW
ncbi:hypothetical protein BU25DRAFT_486499 [Macroventuria anomochaeta]|uniref:Uncharacterized protein n=1 Tax=Macroventuria anomochaeta TaxID=301207 RepID=A0ACB6SIN6_9PLEO|nr:uncharacterized protein BU25DRAFT_486499 [Macroventuria anomochaeta]KAF2633387.1 hypothetical protein BU25DRAFT_486499 [Macroventuria anomochaeta]